VSNQTRERLCERKPTNCELGSPLCLTIMINDVPRRSHQTVNLFAAPARANRSGIHDSRGMSRGPYARTSLVIDSDVSGLSSPAFCT
jgi:hypothetical protein